MAALAVSGCQTTHPDWGKGPVTLSPVAQLALNRYMGTEEARAFAISADGRTAFFVYCPENHGLACEGGYEEALAGCRDAVQGRIQCKILADLHDIVWQGKVTMASADSLMLLKKVRDAKFCYDSSSKTYYVVGGQCMFADEEVTRTTFAGGIRQILPVYCRAGDLSAYYTAMGQCKTGDDEISKQHFDQSLSYCRATAGAYYQRHGACKDGDDRVTKAEFTRKTAETVR
ncbi:MAG: hypothetical protein MJE12_12765 [Alphaproteobacteria bacterium]|nr:hypothetical protein [Alphaproteobacteria bacterium]